MCPITRICVGLCNPICETTNSADVPLAAESSLAVVTHFNSLGVFESLCRSVTDSAPFESRVSQVSEVSYEKRTVTHVP